MNLTRVHSNSARNAQIVTLLCEGFMPKQIASRVDLSEEAVRARLHRIRQRNGVDSNIALVGKVLEARWSARAKRQGGQAA